MKIPIKTNISYTAAIVTVFVILTLTVYFQILKYPLVIPLLLLLLGVHLFFLRKANYSLFLQLGLLIILLMFMTNYLLVYTTIPILYIPVAGFAILIMLLYNDLPLAFLMSFVMSLIVSLLLSANMDIFLIYFIGSLTGIYTVREARTRGKIMGAGFYIGIMQVLTIILLHPERSFMISRDFALDYFRPLFVSGILSSFLVIATLKIFESWFGLLTNFSLLELSDFNQPLLKRMVLEAPGTYHHSLVVSNLSEAASDAIGANALLTRVGAYYHDIGKMEKSEYFTENQLVGGNKHDKIEPSISRLVILNHVKEGVELAKKHKLNPQIIQFIPQHHGTSLMYYFYQKALEDAEDETEVKEENYRYPGPKPQIRETAIVLLADSVEGATRAIDEPNPQKIEDVVRKVINNKFIDGQLDECPLTLKEIETIANTFTRILSAMYHGRVKYPEKKSASDDRNRKSAEESQDPAAKDSTDRQDRS